MKKIIVKILLKLFFVYHNEANCEKYYESKKFLPVKIKLYENRRIRFLAIRWFRINRRFKYLGLSFYNSGKLCSKGVFYNSGCLFKGTNYRENGTKKFKGICNDKHLEYLINKCSYYGPTYPVYGIYYNEKGEKEYAGIFSITKSGSMAYPHVAYPEEYGSIEW